MQDTGLTFDDEACDGCGLCVAACPHEALSLPVPQHLVASNRWLRRDGALLLACERVGSNPADRVGPSELPAGHVSCLHALAPSWLHTLCERHDVSQLKLACGDCTNCERRPASALSLWQRWDDWTHRLSAQRAAVPQLRRLEPKQWLELAAGVPSTDVSRRAFLRRASQPGAEGQAAPDTFTSERRRTVVRLSQAQAEPMWRVAVAADRCSLCMACLRICPEQVFELAPAAPPASPNGALTAQWRIGQARCTGCGLCVDVCNADTTPGAYGQAITLVTTKPEGDASAQASLGGGANGFELVQRQCGGCHVAYWDWAVPKSSAKADEPLRPAHGEPTGPRLCPTCQRGRARQHNRWVQTLIGDNT